VAKTDWMKGDGPFTLDVSRLPLTILNAIEVTRRLGYSFLWIDCLCILQDSNDDKRREIAQMRNIYRNARVTIAAAKSSSVETPFLSHADPDYSMQPFNIPFLNSDGIVTPISVGYRANYVQAKDPWNSRAWTLEEQLLSSRLLIYSTNGLMWQCKGSLQVERDPSQGPKPLLGLPWSQDEIPSEEEVDTHELWADILCNYTQREVTHAKDKLVAFAAIAEEFAQIWQDKYVAGLWQSRLFEDLLWHRHLTSDFRPSMKLMPRPAKYRAPSWSWAAIDGYIIPGGTDFSRESYQFEVISYAAELESEIVPFGAVVTGTLRVKALLVLCTWRPAACPAQDLCDGWVIPPSDIEGEAESLIDPAADINLDALDPELKLGEYIWCLPVARITTEYTGHPFEGLVLKEVSSEIYQRIGYFSNCHDGYLFETLYPCRKEISII